MKTYLIPPRLNTKYMLWGLTIPEIAIIGSLILTALVFKNLRFLFVLAAIIFAISVRFITPKNNIQSASVSTAVNALSYIIKIYKYYFKPQIFTSLNLNKEVNPIEKEKHSRPFRLSHKRR